MGYHSPLTRQLIEQGCAPREVELFPTAYISEGPELEQALASLGLKQARPRLFSPLTEALAAVGAFASLLAALWGSVSFALWVLSLIDPTRVPQ